MVGMPLRVEHARLVEQLGEQVGFLRRSAAAFDEGSEAEAVRLATTIRVLVHDTDTSKSLLGLLGVKDMLEYHDTANPIEQRNLLPTPGLVMLELNTLSGGRYVAPLGMRQTRQPALSKNFGAWWTHDVTRDGRGYLLSRKKYVMLLANKEGGAHIDPNLPKPYVALADENSLGWSATTLDGTSGPFQGNAALPSVRQIAYELDVTLTEQLPEWVASA
jgi:hypothetical protein